MDFFYDKQFRRLIQQFIKMFSDFEIEIDRTDNTYRTVPVRYGDSSRMAAHILRQNSENVINSTPFMSCWVQSVDLLPEARKDPYGTSKVQVFEKKLNPATNTYDNEVGDTYQIERMMPVPYNLTMQVDLWTSNSEQKFQLLEQILTLYNPSINLVSSSNPFDWTRLTYVELTGLQWSNRSIPTGVEDTIDIASMTFTMPIHLSVASKVSKQTLIHTILSNIMLAKNDSEMADFRATGTITNAPSSFLATTYNDRMINVSGTTITLLDQDGSSTTQTWTKLFAERSGALRSGTSYIKLMDHVIESSASFKVTGILAAGSQDDELTWTVTSSTIPADTVTAVTNFIDPTANYPGDGTFASAGVGHRYLLTADLPVTANWGSLSGAKKNDIIAFASIDGSQGTITAGPTYSVNSEEINPRGITFNNDGTKMFIVGQTGDDVNEYTLSTGFDLSSTVTFVDSFNVNSQELKPLSVKFNADGTKMFIVGNTKVHEYALTTGFDVSTASFTQTLVTSTLINETSNFGLDFKPDGTKMYITGAQKDKIYEFNLSTAFDISTATFNQDFHVGNKGDSWASGDWEPFGIEFSTDGIRLFIVGTGGNEVNLYKLSTAWDVSSATFVERYVIGPGTTNPSGIHISPDGTKMFIVGNHTDLVRSYTLSIPYVFTEVVGGWSVSFDSSETSTSNFTTNSANNKKYKWDGTEWKSYLEGNFLPGFWRVYL